jgi:two-component system, cell cycle sensor histidine kinase and response regulator CckA
MPSEGEALKLLVLVVEDDPIVLRSTTASLSSAGFQVVVAQNGAQGLKLYQDLRGQIGLVLADLAMPVLGGLELSDQICAIDPAARILLMSGYSERLVGDPSQLRFPFIRKPFLPQDLVRKVREVMGCGRPQVRNLDRPS